MPGADGPPINWLHIIIAGVSIAIIIWMCTILIKLKTRPADSTGWGGREYTATRHTRKPFAAPDTTPINRFAIATANYGGIMTEPVSAQSPWTGTVSAEAARLQVDAGARAIIFDTWPDPTDRARPVVAAMADAGNTWWVTTGGLHRGVGRYSQWKQLTRNTAPLGDLMKAAIASAFTGPQATDPFFIVLKLHGTMTKTYLDHLGTLVADAIGGRAMGGNWNRAANQRALATEPISTFRSKVFLIVIPEIYPGYDPLPNVSTYSGFMETYRETSMWEVTNAIEMTQSTMFFEPKGLATVSAASQPEVKGVAQTLPQTTLCIVQPSTGGRSVANAALFADASFTKCMQSGAQLVAVNFLGQDAGDETLTSVFSPGNFGTYSFKLR